MYKVTMTATLKFKNRQTKTRHTYIHCITSRCITLHYVSSYLIWRGKCTTLQIRTVHSCQLQCISRHSFTVPFMYMHKLVGTKILKWNMFNSNKHPMLHCIFYLTVRCPTYIQSDTIQTRICTYVLAFMHAHIHDIKAHFLALPIYHAPSDEQGEKT